MVVVWWVCYWCFFFFKQKTAYEMRISNWSSDVALPIWDWHGAQRTASWLAGASRTEGSGLSDAEFWYAAAAKLLAPLLFAATTSGRTISDVEIGRASCRERVCQ